MRCCSFLPLFLRGWYSPANPGPRFSGITMLLLLFDSPNPNQPYAPAEPGSSGESVLSIGEMHFSGDCSAICFCWSCCGAPSSAFCKSFVLRQRGNSKVSKSKKIRVPETDGHLSPSHEGLWGIRYLICQVLEHLRYSLGFTSPYHCKLELFVHFIASATVIDFRTNWRCIIWSCWGYHKYPYRTSPLSLRWI